MAAYKSGVALRFPRILRWRIDKTAADADTLDSIRAFASGTRNVISLGYRMYMTRRTPGLTTPASLRLQWVM